MANQYANSFLHIAPQKFGKIAEELLHEFAEEVLTYLNAAEKKGIKIVTIRKWCAYYGVKLRLLRPLKKSHIEKINLKSTIIDKSNCLYRRW